MELASRAIPAAHSAGNGDSLLLREDYPTFDTYAKQSLSADGRYFVFASYANNLVANDNNQGSDVFRYDRVTDTLELVSVNSTGTGTANGYSGRPTISADGMRVAFDSEATDLGPAVSHSLGNVFVRDFNIGTTILVSMNKTGTGCGNQPSNQAFICDAGTRVAFVSEASNMHLLDSDYVPDVFVRDLDTDTTYLATIDVTGTDSGGGSTKSLVMNLDGTRVAFLTSSWALHSSDHDSKWDVIVRDLDAEVTYLASIDTAGSGSANADVTAFAMNEDGTKVAFSSKATNLHALDANTKSDIFLRDLNTGTTSLISLNSAGTGPANWDSMEPSISADGTRIAFESTSNNLVAVDPDFSPDIYVREVDNGLTRLVSVNSAGTGSANGESHHAMISRDGTKVAFSSSATNLVAEDTSPIFDLYIKDLAANTTQLASHDAGGFGGGNDDSTYSVFSGDGSVVAFISEASNLTAAPDVGDLVDVFVHNLASDDTVLASAALDPASLATSALGDCVLMPLTALDPDSSISADGRYVVFETDAGNLSSIDNNHTFDIYRYDTLTDEVVLVSVNMAGTGSGNADSHSASISADGNRVAFQSYASDLHALDSNGELDVFVRDIDAGVTYLSSINSASTGSGNRYSYRAIICADGTRVAFESSATDLHPLDTAPGVDIYVRDIDAGVTYLASVNSTGTAAGNTLSTHPRLSADGSRVVFNSRAIDLHPLATVAANNTFVRDLNTETTFLVNVDRFGTGASAGTAYPDPVISADGKRVAFVSSATGLSELDTLMYPDIYVRDLDAGVTYLASINSAGTGGVNTGAGAPSLSADGKRVAFQSSATNLNPLATNYENNIYVRDLDSGTTYLVPVA